MEYEDRIVCFLDILGFSDHINQTDTDVEHDNTEKIKEILEAFSSIRRILEIDDDEMREIDGLQITQFSDSVVISFKTDQQSGVFFTLLSILQLQSTMLSSRILLRGAITRGGLIHTDKLLFGPGLIQAHYLESKVAKYPRIILDKEVLIIGRKFRSDDHLPKQEEKYIKSLLKEDSDDWNYIDYFGEAVQWELDDPDYEYPQYLHQTYEFIKKNLSSNEPSILGKYSWMREKYNQEIEKIKQWISKADSDPELSEIYSELKFID